ncbi:MAG TPA: DNA replication/repair protein RecF [candidate division Zixibacteria bacterium]|nr:DNA replication/repair protein RecF [candidate division Zixibacteria bacterium]HPI32040.1 DNA replication/repair protein RecF [candidate division Zixibacteria bacterium]
MAASAIFHFGMILRSLHLQGFRNFAPLAIEFGERVNILYGDNGSGKTNLIEAIFVLCLGRSHRGVPDSVMLQQGTETFRLEGRLSRNGETEAVAVAYQTGGRKKITVEGVPIRPAELYDRFCAVTAGPEDTELLAGSPAARRVFLDIYLAQYSPRYIAQLSDYSRALAQKNAALRMNAAPEAFNAVLVPLGAAITAARARFLEQLVPLAAGHYERISHGSKMTIAYRASAASVTDSNGAEGMAAQYERKLASYTERERAMQVSLVGPHRDDLAIEIGGYPARTHASQGEMRTAAIALKLAVYQLLAARRGALPLLLLDEIFAELDDRRIGALLAELAEFQQLFLTTAGQPPSALQAQSRRFEISGGRIAGVQ